MRILLLTQWYPPEPMELLSDLAETLSVFGHEVTVLTGFPNWPSGKIYPGYSINLKQKEVIRGVTIFRIPLYPYHGKSKGRRVANFASFMISASLFGPLFLRRPDVIHTIQPPTTCLSAWVLSKLWNVPFVYEVQDMWPETLVATGMINSRLVLRWVKRFCDWAYRRAAAIRVISPGFQTNLIKKGVPAEKVHFISNWVDTDFYRPQQPDMELLKRLGLEKSFIVMYAGNIGLAQGIDTVVEAATLIRDLPMIQFVLVGDGVELKRLQNIVQARGMQNVRFLGRYPMEAMRKLYAVADVLLVHLKDAPLFRMTIPHKTLTYLAAGKPILAAIEGDVGDIVRVAGAGLVCPSSNPRKLAEAVRFFFRMPKEERIAFGQNGREAACKFYSKEVLVDQIAQLLKEVAFKRRIHE